MSFVELLQPDFPQSENTFKLWVQPELSVQALRTANTNVF